MKQTEIFDLVIIGGGPAGLTAAIYAARFHLKTLALASVFGGLANEGHEVCNYPGFESISGPELMKKFQSQAEKTGAELQQATVTKIQKQEAGFLVVTQEGKQFSTKAVLLAVGLKHRKLNLPDEERYLGRGLSYCYTCDGLFFKEKVVGIVGGANSAVMAAIYFAKICPQVYLIYRRDKLRAEPAWQEALKQEKNVIAIYNTNITGLYGEEKLAGVKLDQPYQGKSELPLEGLFLEIGQVPDQALTQPLEVKATPEGFIITDNQGKTDIEGVWAAGDITEKPLDFRQIVTAAAEGATAARSIHQWLQENNK